MSPKRSKGPRREERPAEKPAAVPAAAVPATDVARSVPEPAACDPWQDAAGPATPVALGEGPAAALAADLAGLSPAERYERLINFPTDHGFKIIGAAEQSFTDSLRAALGALGYPEAELRPRYSSGTRYVSYTVVLRVADGAAMVRIYDALNGLPGLKYLL